jgi:hypothetical protein
MQAMTGEEIKQTLHSGLFAYRPRKVSETSLIWIALLIAIRSFADSPLDGDY